MKWKFVGFLIDETDLGRFTGPDYRLCIEIYEYRLEMGDTEQMTVQQNEGYWNVFK